MPAYSFKKRFVAPIQAGLGILPGIPKIHAGESFGPGCLSVVEYEPNPNPPAPKRQTIRAIGKRRHARPGEIIQLYCGMRTRQCFKIGEARCISVDPIEIRVREHTMPIKVWGDWIKDGRIHDFARADGFTGGEDMHEFWKKEHGERDFTGFLIRWEPL